MYLGPRPQVIFLGRFAAGAGDSAGGSESGGVKAISTAPRETRDAGSCPKRVGTVFGMGDRFCYDQARAGPVAPASRPGRVDSRGTGYTP